MAGAVFKLSDSVNKITELFVILFFLIVVVATFIQVFSRYVLNFSFSWTEESARFAFIWLNMLGACVCLKRGSHAAITLLVDLFPAGLKKVVQICTNLLILFATSLMIVQGVKVVAVTTAQPSPALGLPMAMIYLCVPVGGVIMAIHTAAIVANLVCPAFAGGKS